MKVITLTETDKDQVITFSYKKIILGTITVQYKDQEGNLLEPEIVKSNLELKDYVENAENFEGYTLSDIAMKTVILSETEPSKTVVFIYQKTEVLKQVMKGSITIKYQDENGTVIGTPDVSSDLVLGTYAVSAKSFDGYSLDGNEKQSVILTEGNKDQVIIFKYKKKQVQTKPDKIIPPQDLQNPQEPEKLPQTGSPIDSTILMIADVLFIIVGTAFTRLKIFTPKNK